MTMVEIKAPIFPESVHEGVVHSWNKKTGDIVKQDEVLLEVETDKIVLEIVAQSNGRLGEIFVTAGNVISSDAVLGMLETGEFSEAESAEGSGNPEKALREEKGKKSEPVTSPSARSLAASEGVDLSGINGSGKNGRITKSDIIDHLGEQKEAINLKKDRPASELGNSVDNNVVQSNQLDPLRTENRVPMSRLRMIVAKRLVESQHQAAMLTTFNEVDMTAVMQLRKKHQKAFEDKYSVRLGFMSLFIRAAVEALKAFPVVNAFIVGDEIVYHDYCDIGVAIGSDRGLVVPVLRNVETKALSAIEKEINQYAERAKTGKLDLEDLQGGTFTVSNGGVFGSLLSTPILNPPQSAILGMHKIQERAVVENGEVVVRPMMYLALSYDHRLIDGREAVLFLTKIKALVEDPMQMLLEL